MTLGLVGVFRQRVLMLGIFGAMLVAHAVQPYLPPSGLDRFANHLQLSTFFMAGTVAYLYRELALDAESNGRKWRAAWYAAKSLAHGRRDDGDRQELLRLALGSRIAGLLKSSAHQSAGA